MIGEYADVLIQILLSLFPEAFGTDMSMSFGSSFGRLRARLQHSRRTKRLISLVALSIGGIVIWWLSFGKVSATLSQPV